MGSIFLLGRRGVGPEKWRTLTITISPKRVHEDSNRTSSSTDVLDFPCTDPVVDRSTTDTNEFTGLHDGNRFSLANHTVLLLSSDTNIPPYYFLSTKKDSYLLKVAVKGPAVSTAMNFLFIEEESRGNSPV